ncbi:MAG: alkaline phosphatase [Candidatus Heimdallarchaeota archaeon]|nr:alkaline phosphatase [Candidatus Heimdallarchaeota archaeon]
MFHKQKAVVLIILLFFAWQEVSGIQVQGFSPFITRENSPQNRSIILMIGDGMGFGHVELGRYLKVGPSGNLSMEATEQWFSVYTKNVRKMITDSAAAATAIATGVKTTNGKVAEEPDGTPLETILEIAKCQGKATGVVTTTSIQHATPACFMAHVDSRHDYSEITRQIVENASVDVLLGGGLAYFTSGDLQAMALSGYTLLTNRSSLEAANASKLLGLFADSHLPYEESRNLTLVPSLAAMTAKALETLDRNPEGFFLMVEGGRIDHASHDNDLLATALEVVAFEQAVEVAQAYIKHHPQTILLVTADHETGGIEITGETLASSLLPKAGMTEDENRTLLLARAANITVNWRSSGHTAELVPLFCFGQPLENLTTGFTIDNTEIFQLMLAFYNHAILSLSTLKLAFALPGLVVLSLWVFLSSHLLKKKKALFLKKRKNTFNRWR